MSIIDNRKEYDMANNVYIGMRYVPIFDGTWDNTKTYEALTIVEYGNNTYTSKKPVPAGTLPTNTTYWALTGNYNGYITQLQNQIDEINNTTIPPIWSAVERNAINVTNRKCIVISDSYADPNRGGLAYGWYTQFCTNSGFTDGVNCKLYQKGGAGFVGAGQGKTFGSLLTDAINDAFFTASDVTDIVVAGGHNDYNVGTSDILTARNNWITAAKTAFPNARIFIAMCAGDLNATAGAQLYGKVRNVYNDSPDRYVIAITNAHLPMMDSAAILNDDGLHPNGQGVVWIGMLIGNAVKEISSLGQWICNSTVGANITRVSGYSGNPNGALTFRADHMELRWVDGASFNPSPTASITYNTGVLIKIGTTSAGAGHFLVANATATNAQAYYQIPCNVWAAVGTAAQKEMICGELIGVASNAYTVEWYFRSLRGPSSFSSGYFDFAPGIAQIS